MIEGGVVEQREIFIRARGRPAAWEGSIVDSCRRWVAESCMMLLSEAFVEQDTAIRTLRLYFWKEEEQIIRMVFQVFGQ